MTAYVLKRKRPLVLQYTGDYTKVGSPTITNNVVSGFSASNYLITKSVFNPLDADFEFVFKINLTSHTINVILAENRTGQFSKVYLCIGKDQKVFFGIGTGSAWRLRVYSNILLELNTDYWIKVVKSNGTFYIYYSLDGKNYILDNSVTDTSVFPSITVEGMIGCWKDSVTGTSYFHGSIDLTESYIKLNGEYWWRGAKYVNVDKCYVLARKSYWKWAFQDWTQPVLTSNNSSQQITFSDPKLSGGMTDDSTGVMTWGSNAVTNFTNIYLSMDSSITNYWNVNKLKSAYTVWDMEFSTPIELTGVFINGTVVASYAAALTGSQIYSIDDNGETSLISFVTTANTNTHNFSAVKTKKIRICVRTSSDGGIYPTRITDVTLTAKKGVWSKATKDYYDFTADKCYVLRRK